jgi:hypothetical protein
MMSKQTKAIRRQRIAAGLCRECARPRLVRSKAYCGLCLIKLRQQQAKRFAYNRAAGLCACGRPRKSPTLKICQQCSDTYARRARHWKQKVIEGYGGKCACCGETHFEFLAADHVKGGGTRERRKFGWRVKAVALYRKIVREGFPPTYRILCHNCNQAIGAFGYCPHQRLKKIATLSESVAAPPSFRIRHG